MARLCFSEDCAKRTDRTPNKSRGPAVEAAINEVEEIVPKLEARITEFLAEWLVSLLIPAQGVLEVQAPHLQKQYWFREIYLGVKVTASFGTDHTPEWSTGKSGV